MNNNWYTMLEKDASFYSSIAKFLVEGLPKIVGGAQTAGKAIGLTGARTATSVAGWQPLKAGLATGAAGATVGGIEGANKAPEGQKGVGALKGAIGGGVLGYVAGGALSKRMPTLGNRTVAAYSDAGKALAEALKTNPKMTPGQFVRGGIDYAAENFENKFIPITKGPMLQHKVGPITVAKDTMATEQLVGTKHTWLSHPVGTLARAVKPLYSGEGVIGTIKQYGKTLGKDWNLSKTFTQDIEGQTFRGRRSLGGRIINPLISTGIGMGAFEAATSKNEDGTPANVGTRLRKGGITALGWGIAPPVMFGKVVYDTSKAIRSGNNQPRLNNY